LLTSVVCRYEHFESDWYRRWFEDINPEPDPGPHPDCHRKEWEYCAIAQTLLERGKLREGSRALGFGVGREPLPSLLAGHGVRVHATDLSAGSAGARRWIKAAMHARGLDELYFPHLVDRETFEKHVSFGVADMREPKGFESRSFDIIWSCCALEHLGSLEAGMRFVLDTAQLLSPGGVAVHTTEYNVSSNERTKVKGAEVVYRERDVRLLDQRLRREGQCLARLDFFPGDDAADRLYDYPPFYSHGRQHIKILLEDFVITSMLLIVLA
jgi:hypothetical protein